MLYEVRQNITRQNLWKNLWIVLITLLRMFENVGICKNKKVGKTIKTKLILLIKPF